MGGGGKGVVADSIAIGATSKVFKNLWRCATKKKFL
jgi:hypothetical protein